MNLQLVKLSGDYRTQLSDMMAEWLSAEQNFSPWSIRKNDYRDFDRYLEHLELKEPKDGRVPDSVFFCLDLDRNIFVGAVNIRHYLTPSLLFTGGHIGDGIRPSERRKGYATAMIGLALDECRTLGIPWVLMTCDKANIGSAKSIIRNGGVLENEVINEEGVLEQRYWINLSGRKGALRPEKQEIEMLMCPPAHR
ncbi:MAG: GNAT family N-acetyltransferase [Candidatus Faecousia sp.]|nr:GNAT family N-acetyltransferase [Clostridiales bacterium]MDY6180096.1 GNAT family N-acetyltransferase [Candidatus Faecousia sp.]